MEENKNIKNKEKQKDKKESRKKEKVSEIFNVDGKKVEVSGTEEIEVIKKGQVKSENKILKSFFLWIAIITFVTIIVFWSFYSSQNFEYKGFKWDVIKEGEVIFYHTSFPLIYQGEKVNYNVYLRNDPRKLEKVPFNGELNLLEMMVINNTDSFVCEGKGGIAMLNFQQILGNLGMNFMKDPNATCDSEGRYMFVQIQEGDETGIVQTGPSCYTLNVNDCEILEVTERFLVESLAKLV